MAPFEVEITLVQVSEASRYAYWARTDTAMRLLHTLSTNLGGASHRTLQKPLSGLVVDAAPHFPLSTPLSLCRTS